jgi:hypothetical protein
MITVGLGLDTWSDPLTVPHVSLTAPHCGLCNQLTALALSCSSMPSFSKAYFLYFLVWALTLR